MGMIVNHALVVTSWDLEKLARAHMQAQALFALHGASAAVLTGIHQYVVNGGGSFVLLPDGSKEGWVESNAHERVRLDLCEWLAEREPHVSFALLVVSGEDGLPRVLDSDTHRLNKVEPA